jgi:hypothetical protein
MLGGTGEVQGTIQSTFEEFANIPDIIQGTRAPSLGSLASRCTFDAP